MSDDEAWNEWFNAEHYRTAEMGTGWMAACEYKNRRIAELEEEIQDRADTESSLVKQLVKTDKRIEELENDNSNAKALIGDLIQAALNDCVESLEWNEVEERVRVFLGDISEEREDD